MTDTTHKALHTYKPGGPGYENMCQERNPDEDNEPCGWPPEDHLHRVEASIIVTSKVEDGVRFLVRIVREGESYGRTGALVADRPTVEFYDTRYAHTELGQFVSRYYLSTLLDDHAGGLDLDGGVDSWKIDSAAMDVVRAWLRLETR